MPAPARPAYHHGNLRQALIDAALAIAAEKGVDKVTVREAGIRAGVSSAAPFRHFASRIALLTAAAEEATQRLFDNIAYALARCNADDPLERFHCMGTAYLRWAAGNPTHFIIVSSRSIIDYDASPALVRLNDDLRATMIGLLSEAHVQGKLRSNEIDTIVVEARALVYGLARMAADGHFAQWAQKKSTQAVMARVLALFIAQLRAD